jgi:hypothetical protein
VDSCSERKGERTGRLELTLILLEPNDHAVSRAYENSLIIYRMECRRGPTFRANDSVLPTPALIRTQQSLPFLPVERQYEREEMAALRHRKHRHAPRHWR